MTKGELEAALQAAFSQCEAAGYALNARQKQIFLQLLELPEDATLLPQVNPLDGLTPDQRQALLQFVRDQDQPNRSWKIKLLDDWLHNRDSGPVQFIRELYGPQWLEQVKPVHLASYADPEDRDGPRLKVGDRIEVSNNLWEWVPEAESELREWFPCTVIQVTHLSETDPLHINCTVRFDNGSEYSIQGMYEWNRYNWRWLQP